MISVVIISILVTGENTYADLKTLMEVGKSQAGIAKSLGEETKNYNGIKEAIIAKELKEGMSADTIKTKYGEPIIDIFDKKKNAYKWLYMPATSTHFKGEKLYLFVDKEGRLVGWEFIEQ
jgi:hypothetical protein